MAEWNSWHRNTITRLIEAHKAVATEGSDVVPALEGALAEIDRLTALEFPPVFTEDQLAKVDQAIETLVDLRFRPTRPILITVEPA